jgi:hypothetical protein
LNEPCTTIGSTAVYKDSPGSPSSENDEKMGRGTERGREGKDGKKPDYY